MATEYRLHLRAEGLRAASLARALDELDRFGELLAVEQRQLITRECFAGLELADPPARGQLRRLARALGERGRRVAAALGSDWDPLDVTVGRAGLLPLLLVLAAAIGLSSNVLGPEKAISVLAPPLLGLIAWNIGVFSALGLGALRAALWPRSSTRLDGWIRRLVPKTEGAGLEGRVRRQYVETWLAASMPLERARWSARLHLLAAVMVAATVAGMYLRGLAFEYRATWESTFLGAETVEPLLRSLLAPALFVLGGELPNLVELRAPATGAAAPWIHAWAVTALLFVIAPRLLLAGASYLRRVRLSRRLELRVPAAYLRRLLAAASTTPHEVLVTPYSYQPKEKAMETVRRLLLDWLGARANVRFAPSVGYGGTLQASSAGWRILLFNLAQTPELEVHGELLEQLGSELADGQKLLVIVDEAPFLERIPQSQQAERRESRRRAWLRNLDSGAFAGRGPRPVFLALDASLDLDLALDSLPHGVWPSGVRPSGVWPNGTASDRSS